MSSTLIYLLGVCLSGLIFCIISRLLVEEKPKDWDIVALAVFVSISLISWVGVICIVGISGILGVAFLLDYLPPLDLHTAMSRRSTLVYYLTRERPLIGNDKEEDTSE